MSTDTRLDFIASLVPYCKTFADVGCDHGRLCQLLLNNKKAEKVYACDVSEKCLQKAKRLLNKYENVEFIVSNGLDKVPKSEVVAICGMGAKTIVDIISRAEYKPYYVLGAQRNVPFLREYLSNNGFEIVQDVMIKEDGKYYDVICAREGSCVLDETQLRQGVFYKTPNPVLKEYLEQKIKTYSSYVFTEKNETEIKSAKETLKWQNLHKL